MGEQESCVHTTRVSKKRAFASVSTFNQQQIPATKNRVVLGELTNLVNVGSDFADKTQTPEPKLKKTVKKAVVQKPVQPDTVVGSEDGSQKCFSPSLIYQHLHSLEV